MRSSENLGPRGCIYIYIHIHTYIYIYICLMIMSTPVLIALAKSLPPLCEDFSWSSDTAWASQMEALSEEAPL